MACCPSGPMHLTCLVLCWTEEEGKNTIYSLQATGVYLARLNYGPIVVR